MSKYSKYYNTVKILTASAASITAVYFVGNSNLRDKKLNASWTTNYEPSVKWNSNWVIYTFNLVFEIFMIHQNRDLLLWTGLSVLVFYINY